MKRFITLLLSFIMIITTLSMQVFASKETNNEMALAEDSTVSTEYFEDGSYMIITVTEPDVTLFATSTKSGSKSASYFNSDDEKEWTITIQGTFSYTGSSSTCTASSVSYTIYDDSWKMKSATASKSGNKAIGNFTCKLYLLGISIKTVEQSLTLSCSSTGTLS